MLSTRNIARFTGIAASAAFCLSAVSPTVAFVDNFDNGDINNSDNIQGFWTNTLSGDESLSEAGGTLTATMDEGAGNGGFAYASADDRFNFYDQPLTYRIEGLGFSGSGGTGDEPATNGNILRLGFNDTPDEHYHSDDAFAFQLRGNGQYQIGWKTDSGSSAWSEHNLGSGQVSGTPSAAEMTVSDDAWELVIEHDGGADEVLSGSHNAPRSDFGDNGDSYLSQTFFNNTSEDDVSTVTVDRVTVVPEPGMLGLLGLGSAWMLLRRRRSDA